MKSVGAMLETIAGLCGTSDVTDWENTFISDNLAKYKAAGKSTSGMTDKVVEVIERIHDKHYS